MHRVNARFHRGASTALERRYRRVNPPRLQLVRVVKTTDYRVVARRFKITNREFKNRIDEPRSMPRVKILRREIEAQMQLWIIVEQSRMITLQPIRNRPLHDVAPRDEVEMQIQRQLVIHADVQVIKRLAMH